MLKQFKPDESQYFLTTLSKAKLSPPQQQFSAAFTGGITGCGYVNGTSAAVVVSDSVELCGDFDADIYAELRKSDELHLMAPPPDWLPAIEKDGAFTVKAYTRTAFEAISPEKAQKLGETFEPNDQFEIAAIDSELAAQLLSEEWSADLVLNTMTPPNNMLGGFGFVAKIDGTIAGGVGCYTMYPNGIEVEIDTRSGYRRRGIATRLAQRMILECGRRGLECHWDAMNQESAALATKLGFSPAGTYPAIQLLRRMESIVKLPPPQKDLAFPLMKALENRRSKRRWKPDPLSNQQLSNLLWAACGITRAAAPRSKSRRTAPSATNSQEIKVYLALEHGLYLYDETRHQLLQIHHRDIRSSIGTQKMMHSAPVGLIYVSDFSKLKKYLAKDEQRKWFVSGTDAAYISQNVYLYCTAAGLSTVVLGLVHREHLHEQMELEAHEKVMYTQVVGGAIEE